MSARGRLHASSSLSLTTQVPSLPSHTSPHSRRLSPCHLYDNGHDALIVVRDLPKDCSAGYWSFKEDEDLFLDRVVDRPEFASFPLHCKGTNPDNSSAVDYCYANIYHYYYDRQRTAKTPLNVFPISLHGTQSTTNDDMVKKRSSIQAILVPSFLQGTLSPESSPPPSPTTLASRIRALSGSNPSSPFASSTAVNPVLPDKQTRQRSMTFSSPRSSPPPAFLLDDDPFANLTSAPSESLKGAAIQTPIDAPVPPLPSAVPRSPLHPSPSKAFATAPSSPSLSAQFATLTAPPPSVLPRTVSGGRAQVRPAHQRPAFKNRPSLPSLHTLARMNVVLTKKVRKGRPGAHLPFEPWDLPSDDESSTPASASPRRDVSGTKPTLNTSVPSSYATAHSDFTSNSNSNGLHEASAARALVNPQPLLPSQIMSLGSIAADVEMTIPVIKTPQPVPSLSPQQAPVHQVAEAYPSVAVSSTFSSKSTATEDQPLMESDNAQHPDDYAETPAITEGDGYAADFLERYHQSSRNSSEDGHDSPLQRISVAANTDTTSLAHEDTFPERPEEDESLLCTSNAQDVQGGKGDSDDVDEVDFTGNLYPHLVHASHEHDASYFAHSDSMLFSSPPSSFTLSRSLSSASRSSYASLSSDSAGQFDGTDDEDGDIRDFNSEMPNRAYRQLMDPSLSSLELDGDVDVSQDVEKHIRTGTSTSTSSRPSLSLTRSSSNGSSDVLYSPTADDYAMFPLTSESRSQHQYSASHIHPELASAADRLQVSPAELSRVVNDGSIASEGWVNSFGEPGMIGEGFGFGFDKLTLTGEKNGEDVGSESLEADMRVNLDKLVHSGDTATNSLETGVEPLPPYAPSASSFPNDIHDLAQTSGVPAALPIPSVLTSAETLPMREDMSGQLSTASRPVSAIKAVPLQAEDGSHSQNEGSHRREHVPVSSSRQGNASTGQSRSGAYSTGYSTVRRYDGNGQDNSDEEDEDKRRRPRRALDRTHAVDAMGRATPYSGESSDEDTDRYASGPSAPIPSKGHYSMRHRLGRSASRSPVHHSPLLAGPGMRPSTNFPLSSSSSRYVSEEDDASDSTDDDVPLAQAIPGALSAQKTIRRQVREEREQKKRERALRNEADSRRERQTTIRPAGTGASGTSAAAYGTPTSRDAAAIAVAAVASSSTQARQRTLTLPGKPSAQPVLNPHDLTRKLQSVQLADQMQTPYNAYQTNTTSSPHLARQPSRTVHSSPHQQTTSLSRAKSFSKSTADQQYPTERARQLPSPMPSNGASPAFRSKSIREHHTQRQSPYTSPSAEVEPPLPNLRHMRSFHRSVERSPQDNPRSLALSDGSPSSSNQPIHKRSASLSRRDAGERAIPTEPVPPLPSNLRMSHEEHLRVLKSNPTSTRTSVEAERPTRTSELPPPLPGVVSRNVAVTQQRVFVGNLQQFHMVEIAPSTTAGDVVSLMDAQGALKGWAGTGGWMVFEIAQDFGLERPIRSYELLADVQSSWLKDKTVNYFMLKLTPLAAPLARTAIPTSSPTHSGYMEYEVKRGKWSKRWIRLKEHSLWISKRENGKDETLLCSLSNFDAYLATRPHRAPKAFTFTVKSTDKLSLFENTDDYMHTFSCSERDGNIWMEKILVARSYVLHQERHVLFGPSSSPTSKPVTPGASLSRAPTRKTSSAHRPAQPLINMQPFQLAAAQNVPHADVFEPGSLLYTK